MGSLLNRFFPVEEQSEEREILILGLANSGKTSVLNIMKGEEEVQDTVPTIGNNVEKINRGKLSILVRDMGGSKESIESAWKCYFDKNVSAVIYVVDSTDAKNIESSAKVFSNLLEEPQLKQAIIIVLANKQDLNGAMTMSHMAGVFKLDKIKDRKWNIFETVAKPIDKSRGITEAIKWLCLNLQNRNSH